MMGLGKYQLAKPICFSQRRQKLRDHFANVPSHLPQTLGHSPVSDQIDLNTHREGLADLRQPPTRLRHPRVERGLHLRHRAA